MNMRPPVSVRPDLDVYVGAGIRRRGDGAFEPLSGPSHLRPVRQARSIVPGGDGYASVFRTRQSTKERRCAQRSCPSRRPL
jgi:hypothetical protein